MKQLNESPNKHQTQPTVKTSTVDSGKNKSKIKLAAKSIRVIRRYPPQSKTAFKNQMEKFLNMKPSDLPQKKKQYACERDLADLPVPKDTIRCPLCMELFERVKYADHACKKLNVQQHYGCIKCKFTHVDIKVLREHIKQNHS